MKIQCIKTEYEIDPIGIDKREPRFSWVFAAGETGMQKSCRIVVRREDGDKEQVWDSGVLETECMTGIRYGGAPLLSWSGYRVIVSITDDSGRTEEKTGRFDTGALDPSDLTAKWISIPCNYHGQTLLIRKSFELKDKPICRARLIVAGLGCCAVTCNGRRVSYGTMGSAVTDYTKRVLYEVYDLNEFLHAGKNSLGFELGYGWYGARKLLAQIHVTFADGTVIYDGTMNCGGWWCTSGAVLENSLYGGETYDARREIPGWDLPDFVADWDRGWMYVFLVEPPAGKLERSYLEPMRVTETYPPVSTSKQSSGQLVFDIGQNISGWARIRVRGSRGAKITLTYGELLEEKGNVDRTNLRSAGNTDVYILKGEGEEVYEPRFTYHGFQFVQAEIEGNAALIEMCGCRFRNDVRQIGYFSCSDPVINRLHRNAVMTEGNNQQGVLTDCPQRDERLGWLNDLGTRVYQTNCNFSMERFYPKVMRDITDTMNEKGAIADTAPFFTGGSPADPVSICYLLLPLSCLRLYGDEESVRKEYPSLRKWVEFLLTRQKDFIMDYSYYGDWVSPAATAVGTVAADETTDGLFVSSLYLYWHLDCISELAVRLGQTEDAKRYAELAAACRKALNARYYNAEEGYYLTDSQAANAMALSLGLVPAEKRIRLAERIADNIRTHRLHCTCGNQGYRHLFYALTDCLGAAGAELLLDVLRNPEYPGWGYMIANGATTVWERWESEMKSEMNSFDHPMFASYDGWLYEYVGGIRIQRTAFGADNVLIAPVFPDSLNYAQAFIDTLRGRVSCSWKREGGKVRCTIEIPANTRAAIDAEGLCELDGRPACEGATVGPGRHEFVCCSEK